ncbi:hypothetical protein AVEN_16896-1 [Araneus ventricosus]|uniref:Uncharacterized protein n=1 Tax=Araneus ventricosus TaxID=182803 RepID=A0A4Y2QEK2_ARAVE|nr:hypothetical protein AVEN_16896-1 [Araneus ventricosus]
MTSSSGKKIEDLFEAPIIQDPRYKDIESNNESTGESAASSSASEGPSVPGIIEELVSCETPVNCNEVDIVNRPQECSEAQHLLSILKNLEELYEEQLAKVQKLLKESQNSLFSTCDTDVGGCNVTQHKISTIDHPLINQYSRFASFKERRS